MKRVRKLRIINQLYHRFDTWIDIPVAEPHMPALNNRMKKK
jgi:hypothetical protein